MQNKTWIISNNSKWLFRDVFFVFDLCSYSIFILKVNLNLDCILIILFCSILDYNDALFSQARLANNDSDSEDDDDDSNDENNWRNDYPDEDEMSDEESVGERQMRRAMVNLDFGNDLSSDEQDEENGFVYSIDAEGFNFEDDLEYGDTNRHGEAYARYRRRVVKEMADYNGGDENDSYGDTYDEVESD